MLTFKKIEGEENSTVELKGKSYPLYTVSAEESGVLTVGKDGSLLCDAAEGAKGSAIAVIPYKDAAAWSGAKADDEEYGESYLLYSADSGAGTDGKAFIAMTSSSGAGLAAFSGSSGEKKCCFELSKYKASAKHFTCRASLVSSKGQTGKRTATGYRFSFIYWDKDITYGVPGAMVEVELASNKRNSVKLTVGRIDATGSKVERVPAMFRYNVDGTNHVYSDKAESLTFSGKKSTDSTVETAYFTVGLNEMAKLVEGFENDAFLWTVDVAGNGAKVKKIRMKDGEGNLLFETAIPDSYPTLGKGEKYSFVIDLGGELKEYSAEPSGVQRIVNKESGLYLTKQKMAVVLQEKPTDDGKFEIKYDSLQGYSLYAEKTKYLLDITGKEITEGVEIKLNAPFDTRDTQNFDLLRQKDGCFQIALRADPSYILTAGEDGKVVLAKADTAGQSALWKFVEREEGDGIPSSVKAENGTVTYTALLPKNVDGAPTVYVTDAEGKEIFKGKAEKSGEKLSVSFPAPEKGNYLIRTEIGGKPAGVQTLYTVK